MNKRIALLNEQEYRVNFLWKWIPFNVGGLGRLGKVGCVGRLSVSGTGRGSTPVSLA